MFLSPSFLFKRHTPPVTVLSCTNHIHTKYLLVPLETTINRGRGVVNKVVFEGCALFHFKSVNHKE